MKEILRSALVMIITACVTIPAANAESYEALVVGIADGDTIKVLHDGRAETLRLADIDCPEKKQAYGAAAKQFTAKLVFRKTVLVDTVGHDRYRRSIAQVKLKNGESLKVLPGSTLNTVKMRVSRSWREKREVIAADSGRHQIRCRPGRSEKPPAGANELESSRNDPQN